MSRRRAVDAGRLGALAARPGIDPRVWVTYARVLETAYDPEHGLFADVQYLPSGDQTTALVGSSLASAGAGVSTPLNVGDLVLVLVPMGDDDHGPVIVSRLWSGGARPPASGFGGEDDGTGTPIGPDVVLVAPAGAAARATTNGANIELEATGDASKLVARATDVVQLQDGSQAFVRGNDFADATGAYLDAQVVFLTALGVFFGALNTVLSAVFPAITAHMNTVVAAVNVYKTAVNTYKSARSQYLSTKVKGQ